MARFTSVDIRYRLIINGIYRGHVANIEISDDEISFIAEFDPLSTNDVLTKQLYAEPENYETAIVTFRQDIDGRVGRHNRPLSISTTVQKSLLPPISFSYYISRKIPVELRFRLRDFLVAENGMICMDHQLIV